MASAPGTSHNAATTKMTKEELFLSRSKGMVELSERNIAQIRAEAKAHREYLAKSIKISEKIEEGAIQVAKIYLKRNTEILHAMIYGKAPTSQPMRKVPLEILGHIFQYHVESDQSPWILVKVCKTWMEAARATPRLWRHLLLTDQQYHGFSSYVFDGKTYHSSGNKQMCWNLTQLNAAIHRAGVVPLTITLEHSAFAKTKVVPQALPGILKAPFCTRIEHLDIYNSYLSDEDVPADMPMGPFPCMRGLRLQSLASSWVRSLLTTISLTSKHLDTFQFDGSISVPANFTAYSFWRSLIDLKLPLDYPILVLDLLNKLVPQLVRLERLTNTPHDWPNDNTPTTELPGILHIALNCKLRHLSRIVLPQVKELSLTEILDRPNDPPSTCPQLSFPRVTIFSLKTEGGIWPRHLTGAFPVITTLTLNCRMSDEVIISILKSIPTVEFATIANSDRQDFGIGLLQALRSVVPVLCPNMKTLELGEKDDHIYTLKKTAKPLLKELFRYPTQLRVPLCKVTIHWKRGTQVILRGQRWT